MTEKVVKYVGFVIIGFIIAWWLKPVPGGGGGNFYDTTYIYDTLLYEMYDTIPVPVQVVENLTYEFYDTITIYDTIPIAEDTTDIIKDYYRLRIYNEVFADDNLEFHLFEQVGANRVLKRSTSYRILRPDKIITKHHQYLYGGVSLYPNGASVNLLYSNQRFIGGLGYDPMNKGIFVTGGLHLLSW
jgi:hypothetical protein